VGTGWLARSWGRVMQGQTRFQDPYYRFESIAELRAAAAQGVRLDVNQATVDDWLRLPGLSIHQARALVQLSQTGVAFHCLEDVAAALSLPLQRLQPLAPILQFCYYEPERSSLNPNRASLEQAAQILGPERAQAVIGERQRGAYRNLSDLQRRLGWSGEQVAELMHLLRFD
jgi:DNA uptake protein ComE-like DNA-binding protein